MAHEYKIVAGERSDVEHAVNQLLKDGWRLHGAMNVYAQPVQSGHSMIVRGYYSQAMIKYDTSELLNQLSIS